MKIIFQKLASLTLPWTIVTGILTSMFFLIGLTGISLVLQDSGEILQVEAIFFCVHLVRACEFNLGILTLNLS